MPEKPRSPRPAAPEKATFTFHPDLRTDPTIVAAQVEAARRLSCGEPGATLPDVLMEVLTAADARRSMTTSAAPEPAISTERTEAMRKIVDQLERPQ